MKSQIDKLPYWFRDYIDNEFIPEIKSMGFDVNYDNIDEYLKLTFDTKSNQWSFINLLSLKNDLFLKHKDYLVFTYDGELELQEIESTFKTTELLQNYKNLLDKLKNKIEEINDCINKNNIIFEKKRAFNKDLNEIENNNYNSSQANNSIVLLQYENDKGKVEYFINALETLIGKEQNYENLSTNFKKYNLKWNTEKYSSNDLIELITSLYESEAIKGKMENLINALAELFDIDMKDFYSRQTLLQNRYNDRNSSFLEKLKLSFRYWFEKRFYK
jgi:hypothetical protein